MAKLEDIVPPLTKIHSNQLQVIWNTDAKMMWMGSVDFCLELERGFVKGHA
jgi:hypothetical protein